MEKEPTGTLFLHHRTTSISLCFAADSRTEQVSFYLSFNFHLQFKNKMLVPYVNTISNRYHFSYPHLPGHQECQISFNTDMNSLQRQKKKRVHLNNGAIGHLH